VNPRPLAAALLVALGCGPTVGHIDAPEGGTVAVGPATALAFQARAEAFYARLIKRRFNALETFNDPFLREHFRSVDRFFDYYASLATDLDDANFQKSRPNAVEVQEFVFASPTEARVLVLFTGKDDRPLRGAANVGLLRLDRWERSEERWWIRPGKL
jgi:hypothetical protein